MIVLVCGGRDFDDMVLVHDTLDELARTQVVTGIIHGGATGADHHAGIWAHTRRRGETVFRADWQTHGRKAGPLRNQELLDVGKPALVVAFPGGRGTADMVRRAEKAGVRVMKIDDRSVRSNGTPDEEKHG